MFKNIVGALVCLLALVAVPVTVATSAPATASAATLVTSPVHADRPAEDDAAFNPCTMGVDHTYPASDPRHWTPGPCNHDTRLPYGGRFVLTLVPVEKWTCGAEWPEWTVYLVTVYTAIGTDAPYSSATAVACAPTAYPLEGGVQDVLPELYRAAGSLYQP